MHTMASRSPLKICSYNSHGHGAGRNEYIQKLCAFNDFVMIHEHWSLDSQLSFFDDRIRSISSHCISGMVNSELTRCPYGGCGILWRSYITSEVIPLRCECKCLCTVSVYMPCKSRSSSTQDTREV